AAITIDGHVWAIGGNDANGPALATVDVYDPASDRWTAATPIETARYGLSVIVFSGDVYAIGGQDGSGALPTVEVASPTDGRWRSGPAMPESLTRLALAVLNGGVHAVEGA